MPSFRSGCLRDGFDFWIMSGLVSLSYVWGGRVGRVRVIGIHVEVDCLILHLLPIGRLSYLALLIFLEKNIVCLFVC